MGGGRIRIGFFVFTTILATLSAAVAAELCVGSAAGDPGTTVAVPIVLDDSDGVAGFQVDIEFNTDWMTFVRVRLGTDTTAAGGWSINSAPQGEGIIRVLAFSAAGTGLTPGFKEMALVDFDVVAATPIRDVPFPLSKCTLGDELGVSIPCSFCVQPGLGSAFPRFATVLADDSLSFLPDSVTIEQGDWVSWRNIALLFSHSTTSGSGCTPDGLWDGGLMPGGTFARQFLDPPAAYLYDCAPHCTSGHDGDVIVTDRIVLDVIESPGSLDLSWSGGSGLYRVFRSPNPQFVGSDQVEFVPDGGDTGTSLSDHPIPGVGEAVFYIVVNKF